MRNVYSLELLRAIHLSYYTYFNEEFNEVYCWFGGEDVKIYNLLGEEIGHSNIVNCDNDMPYSKTDEIPLRDVQLSIDAIVNTLYA